MRTQHVGPLALFAGLAVGWTWPLALHLREAIPGDPGDNYSFLWYLWWMRHVLATPGLAYFHTTSLFYPFGASIADNPHTVLPSLVAATLLGRASIVTAQNVLLLAYVFANMTVMYALAYDVAGNRASAALAGVIFGLSPYVAMHFPGHFELMAVWTLPAFAFFFRRACQRRSALAAIAAGLTAGATGYTSYYYFVYEAMFAAVFLVAWNRLLSVSVARRDDTGSLRVIRPALLGAVAILAAVTIWIAVTGGGWLAIGGATVSATRPQGPLGIAWLLTLAWVLCTWRVRAALRLPQGAERTRIAVTASIVAAVALTTTAPLLWQAARLMMSGDYVTPTYFWRSAPRGVDAMAPLLGHPGHTIFGALSTRVYHALRLDPVESIGWLGIAPVAVLLFLARARDADRRELRAWSVVAVVFAVWAAGPFLTIGGFDTGLKLPEILARWIPLVANARMPGRAMVVVFLAIAVLAAIAMRTTRAAIVWGVALIVAAEFWIAPVRLTYLDTPAVYRTLAAAPPGAVCEVPFGVGDGLSRGAGSQNRRVLYYATLHEHPLVGGYLGRMPTDADQRYDPLPIVGALLRLSDGRSAGDTANVPTRESPCAYLVVNRADLSPALLTYVDSLPTDRLGSGDGLDLLRLR